MRYTIPGSMAALLLSTAACGSSSTDTASTGAETSGSGTSTSADAGDGDGDGDGSGSGSATTAGDGDGESDGGPTTGGDGDGDGDGDIANKALVVFIDGFIPEGIDTSDTPAIDALMANAAWSRSARAESTTISGSGWASFLTGVHWDKHQVPDNAFANPNFGAHPHLFARVKQALPNAVVGGCQSWEPIESGLVIPSAPDFSSFHDYYDYSNDYWDADSADTFCAQDVIGFAGEPSVDLLVVMFGELDGVAHAEGYGAQFPSYQAMLSKIDGHIGDIVAAIEARPTYSDENWMVLITSDHGGEPMLHHGYNLPEHRTTPFIVSSATVVTGEIWPPPQTVDVLPTTMRHLGATVDPAWGIDGVAVGFAPSAPPVAAFGDNLIFNGDGEYERGYTGYTDVPDASLPGWSDPGYLTTVRYDSPGGYPASTDPGPASRGENFFAGGWVSEDTWATWSMDVSNLSAGIDAGASWSLSAWLGGYADQNDAATLTASFRDDADAELATATIGPVTAADRGNATGMLERTATGAVPAGTRSITVTLAGDWSEGFNDGYADNLSLVLTPN